MKKALLLIISNLIVCAGFAQMDMGGPPKKEKKKTKSEIVSPTKHSFSKVHKKNKKKIVFSKSAITKNEENPGTFVSKWSIGEPLFMRAYYDQTLMEAIYDYKEETGEKFSQYYAMDFGRLVVAYIDGKELATYEVEATNEEASRDWVTHSGVIFDPKKETYGSGAEAIAIGKAFSSLDKRLKPGSYDLKLEIYAIPSVFQGQKREKEDRRVLLSSGSIDVTVTSDGLKEYNKYMCRHILEKDSYKKDKELEKEIALLFTKENKWKTLSVTLVDPDWIIKKNSLGIPLFRFISANVVYVNDKGETKLVMYQVKQDYSGAGNYASAIQAKYFARDEPYCAQCAEFKNNR